MPIPLKNIYISVVIVLITSFSNVFAENASYEVFKAYQSYSRNWMNRDAAAIATENFHTQVNINNESIAISGKINADHISIKWEIERIS